MKELHPVPTPARDPEEADIAEFGKRYQAFVERAMQYHEQHGVWPPDPLLDEVDEMRWRIMAKHGGDWRKVLDSYVERGKNPRAGEA